jgi:uncharacterized membrane protein
MELTLYITASTVSLILFLVIWCTIFSKAGYSGWMGVWLIVPILNIVIIVIFLFNKWPVQRRAEKYLALTKSSES